MFLKKSSSYQKITKMGQISPVIIKNDLIGKNFQKVRTQLQKLLNHVLKCTNML